MVLPSWAESFPVVANESRAAAIAIQCWPLDPTEINCLNTDKAGRSTDTLRTKERSRSLSKERFTPFCRRFVGEVSGSVRVKAVDACVCKELALVRVR